MSIDISRNTSTLTMDASTMNSSSSPQEVKPTQPIPPKSTTVKTDKPRPHVCATCTRSFARLEHLKRHERSHTKEKPFQCPVCERCFARRDLLLRHKQKLHADFPDETSSTKSSSRKSSTNSAKSGSKRKSTSAGMNGGNNNSTSSSATANSESPPNNTMYSDLLRNKVQKSGTRSRTMSFSASSATSYSTNKQVENYNQYPTAPPQVGFSTPQLLPATFSDSSDGNPFDDFFTASDPLFINPQLLGHEEQQQQNHPQFSHPGQQQQDQHPNFLHDRPQQPHDVLKFDSDDLSWLESPHNHHHHPSVSAVPPTNTTPQSILNNNEFSPPTGESPLSSSFGFQNGHTSSGQNHSQQPISPHDMFNMNFNTNNNNNNNNNAAHFDLNLPDENFWKLDGANAPNSNTAGATAGSSHIITPQLRLHILTTLSTPTPFSSNPTPTLPSTLELQRYINAYIENFSKHMPFLHHTLEFTPDNVPLALDMAAIGALYAFEQSNAAAIFEISRCCIHIYLESKHNHKAATSDLNDINNFLPKTTSSTPLWLVQSLLLGVIYGLFSGDSKANEIAVAQANAVISLTKSAGLNLPALNFISMPNLKTCSIDEQWKFFVNVQERIRTMHVVHTLSCLLATSYNVMPSLKNEEIKCGTPSDESLWTAPNAASWWEIMKKKSLIDNNNNNSSLKDVAQGHSFNEYLNQLINGQTLINKVPQFTLLSLMYGLHLEIHDRKLKYDNNDDEQPLKKRRLSLSADKEQEWLENQKLPIESMLRAWETTWSLSPLASLNPSSQYGPLMSDSIPLSSLAHIRTYIDLRKIKQYFWKRDFETMGKELDNIKIPVVKLNDGREFNALLEATSYAADTISLWEKHSVKWTLETSVSQTFIHTIVSLFDCGLVMSEFLKRLDTKNPANWNEEESSLVCRIVKILQRVIEVVGKDDIEGINEIFSDDLTTVLDLDSKKAQQQQQPHQSKGLCIIVLKTVGKILSKSYVWPFALVMGQALEKRSEQLRSL